MNFYCKEINLKNTKIWRIVDIFGYLELNYNLYDPILKILIKNKVEYIDFVCWGKYVKLLLKCGFIKKNKYELIPEYFEPLIKENKNINLFIFKNLYKKEKLLIVKGDGDQDRLNKIL